MILALTIYAMAPILLLLYFALLIRKPYPGKRQREIMDIGNKTAGMGLQDLEGRSRKQRR